MVLKIRQRMRSNREQAAPEVALRDDALLSPALMASLQRLRITAPRVQRGTFAGEHRSKRRGSSPEFADFKSYSPGDDIRRVDWNLYARLDTLFVRVSEVTTDLTVHIVLDSSASMDWRSNELLPTKARYAKQLAAVLGYVTLWHFDRVRVAPFSMSMVRPLGPLTGRTRVSEMLDYLTRSASTETSGVAETLHRFSHLVSSPGMLIVISDLLSDDSAELSGQLRSLLSRGWDILLVHVLDPAERDPDQLFSPGERSEPITLVDSEDGAQVLMMPGAPAFETYRSAFDPWLIEMAAMAKRNGARYAQLNSDQPLEPTAIHLLHEIGLLS